MIEACTDGCLLRLDPKGKRRKGVILMRRAKHRGHERICKRRTAVRRCFSCSDDDHLLVVDVHFDEDGVVLDVLECGHRVQVGESLRAEARVPVADRPAEKRLVLLADVRLDGVGDVPAIVGVFALIEQRERDAVRERPG